MRAAPVRSDPSPARLRPGRCGRRFPHAGRGHRGVALRPRCPCCPRGRPGEGGTAPRASPRPRRASREPRPARGGRVCGSPGRGAAARWLLPLGPSPRPPPRASEPEVRRAAAPAPPWGQRLIYTRAVTPRRGSRGSALTLAFLISCFFLKPVVSAFSKSSLIS